MKVSAPELFAAFGFLYVGAAFLGCGSEGQVGAGPGSGAGEGGIVINPGAQGGSAARSGSPGGASGTPGTAANCGTTTVSTSRTPADMLIVLDRSTSMTYSTDSDCTCGSRNCGSGTTCTDRWTAVKSAVSATVAADATINWGLEFFASPSGGNCTVASAPQVPIAANSAATIQSQIAGATPGSYTPTAGAINAATAYLKTVNDGNRRAILLATDGMPNCPGGRDSTSDDLAGAQTAVTAANTAGFPVYVVGIGPQQSITNLNTLAAAGGTGNYYPASSPQQLSDALSKIAKIVATCTFTSAQPPPDPSLVAVYVDKNLVQQSSSNGWTFGSNNSTIDLHGTPCDNIMAGKASQVQIVFGCPGVTPPQIIP